MGFKETKKRQGFLKEHARQPIITYSDQVAPDHYEEKISKRKLDIARPHYYALEAVENGTSTL